MISSNVSLGRKGASESICSHVIACCWLGLSRSEADADCSGDTGESVESESESGKSDKSGKSGESGESGKSGKSGVVGSSVRRHQPLSAAGASEAAAQHPRRQGGERQRQVRRLRFPQERQYRRRRRVADVPGHRHRDHHGQERRNVITDGDDEAALTEGARDAYLRRNLRYSQVAPLSMYVEKNIANNMPAQCEIYAEGDYAYKFMFMAKAADPPTRAFCSRRHHRC